MSSQPTESSDDEALIRQHRADPDGPAAGLLIARWQDRVLQWAHRVVRDPELAMDIAQDSFIRMYRSLDRYEPHGRFGAWLFTIVMNRARSAIRTRPLTRDVDFEIDQLVAAEASPEDVFEDHDSTERLMKTMDEVLTEAERTAIWLRAYEGLEVDDITAILGLQNATGARGMIQTARRKLKRALGMQEPTGGTS